MRLFQKKIWDIEDLKKDEEGDEEEIENENQQSNQLERVDKKENDSEFDSKNVFRNRKIFITWLNEENIMKSTSISYLRIIAIGFYFNF